MSEASIEVTAGDLAAFEATLEQWMIRFGKSVPETLRKQARLICVNLAHNTQPYGLDSRAMQQGQAATARDIRRVYVPVTKIFATIAARNQDAAKGFIAAVRGGDEAKAREIMRAFQLGSLTGVPFGKFDPGIHNQLRLSNRRGRISPNLKPRLLVTDPAALSRYQKAMARRVGYGKSGWATCADQLGGSRGIPLWAKRHRAPAHVEDRSGELANPRIVMTSDVPFIDTILPDNMRRDAVEKQRGKMEREIAISLDKAARASRAAS